MRLRAMIPAVLLLGVWSLVVGSWQPAVAGQAMQQGKPLRVATKPLEPFVIKRNERWAGFSVDLWDKIAEELDWKYDWVEVKTVTDQLAAVQVGSADLAMAGISITSEREAVVDFSHPYFNSGLQIMVPTQVNHSALGVVTAHLSPALLEILGLALLFLIVMAHLVWLAERGHNPEMPRAYLPGIWEAAWWALGTVGTLEYGDKSKPRTPWRRLFAMAWITLSIVLIAQFTAAITASLTVRQLTGIINGPDDLPGKSVATVRGSTAAQYLDEQQIGYVSVERIEDAYDLLATGDAQAVVYDAPVLLYHAANKGKGRVQMVGPIFEEETYGIALPTGSPLRKPINGILLKLKQDGVYQEIYDKWFTSK